MNSVTAFNAESLAASEYTCPWTTIVEHNDVLFGLSSLGLERLGGPLEPGARTSIKTGKMNLRPGTDCAVHPLHLLLASNGALLLNVEGDVAGTEETVNYSIPLQPSSKRRQRRISLARGVKASAWSFEITSEEGGTVEWSLSSMAVDTPAVRYPRN